MADFRHESKFRDRFVRRTIEHALPRPDWWRIRIEDLTEDMKTVRKGRLLLVTEKMLYTVEKDGLKKLAPAEKRITSAGPVIDGRLYFIHDLTNVGSVELP